GHVGVQATEGEQGPPAMRARVPVEAAEEDRTHVARRAGVVRLGQHLHDQVGVLPRHVAQGRVGETARESGVQASRHDRHREERKYISSMLANRMTTAVGSWARITPFRGELRSGNSRRLAGTTLKLAAMGVISVPQNPASMPMAQTMAGSPPNWPTRKGRPIAAVITGKAAKALPMMTVNSAMPRQ